MDDRLLSLLPSLIALVEEGGVGRAAKRVGVSQPRMSARLGQLRALLGDPLLVAASGTRGLVATERAEGIAVAASSILRDLDNAIAGEEFDATVATRTFTIMANDNAAAIVGLPLVNAVRTSAGPGIRVALHQFDAARLGELENGRIDLALGAPAQFERTPSLISRTIVRDRFVSAVRLGEQTASDIESYCARDHVLVSGDGGGFIGLVDRALEAIGRSRHVALSVQNYLLAIEAVAASDMVATLPRSLLFTQANRLHLFKPPVDLQPFTLAAAWHARNDDDLADRWLRETLSQTQIHLQSADQ